MRSRLSSLSCKFRLVLFFALADIPMPQVLRRVIQTAANGDTIEISCSLKPSGERTQTSTFDITHRASGTPVLATFSHSIFQTGLGLLKARISASTLESQGRKYQLLVPLKIPESNSGLSKVLEEEAPAQPYPHIVLASEPTSTELSGFAESLRGTKVALHASSSTPFAQCLTANLTAWGMEITHLSTDKGNMLNNTQTNDESAPSSSEASSSQSVELAETLPRFIIIDEDVEELRRRTLMFSRSPVNMHPRRPPLIHRPKSHHRGAEAGASHNLLPAPTIIFFTSLTKYNVVRDAVQSIEAQALQSGLSVPEIFALPKPVGTRRFLTALYAAFNKPLLDPLFAPIATSPSTPPALNPFLDSGSNKSRTPPEARSRTERTPTRSPREVAGFHPHSAYPGSPLAMEVDTAEYFQQTDVHALGQTPSSGMLIQSPDGQPAGIFFKPPTSKSSRHSGGNGLGVKFSDSKEASGARNNGPSIETLRRSTRHLSDEFPIIKSVPHPFTFLRSKTTPQLPGALPHASGTPTPVDGSQRWRPGTSSVSDNGSSRVESTRDANQSQAPPQDDHLPSQSVDPMKRVASPPRARSSLENRKTSSPGIFKLADNTIVPPINVLIVEGIDPSLVLEERKDTK
jgi:osomolarity two-component system response regulator SSK1